MIGVVSGLLMSALSAAICAPFCDDSTSYRSSRIGLMGGIFMMIGGMIGAYLKRWVTLVPGFIVVLVAFALLNTVLWILVVMAVLLLWFCLFPQHLWLCFLPHPMKREHEVMMMQNSTLDVDNEMGEMRTYKDETDTKPYMVDS